MRDPFREADPLATRNPFLHPHRAKAMRKAGSISRARDFGGKRLRKKGHIRHISAVTGKPLKRRIEGKRIMAGEEREKKERTRRLYAAIKGEYHGDVRDPRLTRSRRIEREDA